MKINRLTLTGTALILLVTLHVSVLTAHAADTPNTLNTLNTAVIPGDIDRICYYTDFFYNYGADDFFYYLNDRLLFLEKPDGILIGSGLRHRLLKIVRWHKVIKKSLVGFKNSETGEIAVDASGTGGFEKASVILNLLGLRLTKDAAAGTGRVGGARRGRRYRVDRDLASTVRFSDYFRFILLRPMAIERRLNKTHRFTLKLKETRIPVPWDYRFLSEITGLELNGGNFFETLLKDERFSLLLGVLYRLSDEAVNHIAHLPGGWEQVYRDPEFLMGMFLLSGTLRVTVSDTGNRCWAVPGGKAAEPFWNELAGEDRLESPLAFLRSLAVKDEGKLNYFFQFTGFLAPGVRKLLFTGPNARKMREIYGILPLSGREKLKGFQFPGLKRNGIYTLLYALRVKDGRFHFPGGLRNWLSAIRGAEDVSPEPDVFTLMRALLVRVQDNNKSIGVVYKFVSLYTKFYRRPQLLTKEMLRQLFRDYENYNVMVDFIEKLPIEKPAAAWKLIDMRNRLQTIENKKDRALAVCIFQSLLELISHAAKYGSGYRDYEALIEKLTEIPLDRSVIYDNIIRFLDTGLGVGLNKKSLIDILTEGIDNRVLSIDNTDYTFNIKDAYRENIEAVLRSQQVCPLPVLLAVNRALERLPEGTGKGVAGEETERRLTELFNQLPYAEISRDAPRNIRDRVMCYSQNAFKADRARLIKQVKRDSSGEEQAAIAWRIKNNYLLCQLKNYLLALAYAVNAKNPGLKIFLNPNLVRLHDFSERRGRTPWNYSGPPPLDEYFSEYHLSGGLSRLNLSLAAKWCDHLFKRAFIHNPTHIQAVIINLLEFYPVPLLGQSLTYNGLLVDLGRELTAKAAADEALKEDLIKELGTITSGFRYREAVRYLRGKTRSFPFFFSDLRRVGEIYFKKGKYLEGSRYAARLRAFDQAPLRKIVAEEDARFGGIYYRTFGNLIPHRFTLFPREVSTRFASGWLSGEMMDEFKIRLSWHLYKKQIPALLLGQVLYRYFSRTAPRFLNQNHANDYISIYFMFDMFNQSHLTRLLKNLQKEGHLKLK
ncbi:MAG: hypothetical protein GY950_03210 [bacterium]|nr:hypothetical protein [bacterium]